MTNLPILTIIALALLAAVLSVFLQQSRLPVFAVIVTLAAGALIFIRLLPSLSNLLEGFQSLSMRTGLNSYYFAIVLKIIGIAYLAEFGAQLCRDAGQGAVAVKIELAAKVGILLIGMPIISAILQSILRLLA